MKTRNKKYNPQKLQTMRNQGEEYEVDTLIVKNPKNMDELEDRAKQYCALYAFNEDLLLHSDECYFEVRA